MPADMRQLLDRYEALGRQEDFLEAKRLYEQALAESPDDAQLHRDYGYLLECQARNQLRQAVAEFERAIELDPASTKNHYQLISARAGLLETEIPIAIYERRLAERPEDPDAYRLLAAAYLAGRRYDEARRVIDAGLSAAPDEPALIERRGELRAGTGDPDGALDDWRRAHQLDPDTLSPVYSSAFLLEREGRIAEAEDAWRYIIEWSLARSHTLDAEWPRRELERLAAVRSESG